VPTTASFLAVMTRPDIDYYVLDALATDLESLEEILRLVNHPQIGWAAEAGHPFGRSEVLVVLPRLVRDELV
jgi:hypothetical protein